MKGRRETNDPRGTLQLHVGLSFATLLQDWRRGLQPNMGIPIGGLVSKCGASLSLGAAERDSCCLHKKAKRMANAASRLATTRACELDIRGRRDTIAAKVIIVTDCRFG